MAYSNTELPVGDIVTGRPSHGGNEAKIFIMPILGGKINFFAF